MSGVYHVVCHECPFEELYEGYGIAADEQQAHETEHDHRVSKLEISRPDSATPA